MTFTELINRIEELKKDISFNDLFYNFIYNDHFAVAEFGNMIVGIIDDSDKTIPQENSEAFCIIDHDYTGSFDIHQINLDSDELYLYSDSNFYEMDMICSFEDAFHFIECQLTDFYNNRQQWAAIVGE